MVIWYWNGHYLSYYSEYRCLEVEIGDMAVAEGLFDINCF